MNFSVSVSDIDTFRRYRETEEVSLGDLLRSLRRQEDPTPAMLAGTALHAILENPPDGDEGIDAAERNGHTFTFTLDADIHLMPLREIRGNRVYVIGPDSITVRGRVDMFDGTSVVDHKLTQNFDAERYTDKYQWRLYLSIFGCDRFVYNVFVGKEAELREWTISAMHQFTVYRYPEMEGDVLRELGRFIEFAKAHLPEAVAA